MTSAEIQATLDIVFDQAIVYHGFTDYMRDYEVVLYCTADPITGIAPAHERCLFRYCVAADVRSAVPSQVWARSLDERLIDYASGVDLDGYVWGVKWQVNYPGATVVPNSDVAARWEADLGIPFYEVTIQTNGHNIGLVFSELTISEVDAPYVPHVIGPGGPDFKIPLSPRPDA